MAIRFRAISLRAKPLSYEEISYRMSRYGFVRPAIMEDPHGNGWRLHLAPEAVVHVLHRDIADGNAFAAEYEPYLRDLYAGPELLALRTEIVSRLQLGVQEFIVDLEPTAMASLWELAVALLVAVVDLGDGLFVDVRMPHLLARDDLEPLVAAELKDYASQIIRELRQGQHFRGGLSELPHPIPHRPFDGKRIAFSGHFRHTDERLAIHAVAAGGRVDALVDGDTNILVVGVGDAPLLPIARELGVTLITEGEFLRTAGQVSPLFLPEWDAEPFELPEAQPIQPEPTPAPKPTPVTAAPTPRPRKETPAREKPTTPSRKRPAPQKSAPVAKPKPKPKTAKPTAKKPGTKKTAKAKPKAAAKKPTKKKAVAKKATKKKAVKKAATKKTTTKKKAVKKAAAKKGAKKATAKKKAVKKTAAKKVAKKTTAKKATKKKVAAKKTAKKSTAKKATKKTAKKAATKKTAAKKSAAKKKGTTKKAAPKRTTTKAKKVTKKKSTRR